MADYCVPLPGQIIAEMFGVPVDDGIRLKGWAEELGLFINGALGDPSGTSASGWRWPSSRPTARALVEQYRLEPGRQHPFRAGAANDDDDALTEVELIATCMLILDAGYKTVQNAMANALMLLMASPADGIGCATSRILP